MNTRSDIARNSAVAPLTAEANAAVARGMRTFRKRKVLDQHPRGYWTKVFRTSVQLSVSYPKWKADALHWRARQLVDEAISEGRLPILEGPKQQTLDLILEA